ncbi:hypothetical protein BH24CHL8_BH24CHL8_04620 [soil metagenome]
MNAPSSLAWKDLLGVRRHYPGLVRPTPYTKARIKLDPMITGVAALGAGLLAVTVWRSRRD